MHAPKHINILKSLNKEELRLLGRFLSSPIHNSNKNIIKLYNYLKALYPQYPAQKAELEILYKKIFPSKTYNEKIIRNIVYEFSDRLEDFLALKNFLNDSLAFEKHLLDEAQSKKLDKVTESHMKKADDILSAVPIRDERYYSSKAFIEQKRFIHEFATVSMGKSLALSNIKEEYIKNASCFFILVMLSEYFTKMNRENQINSTIELRLAEHIMSFLDSEISNYKDEPSIYLLYRFLKLDADTPVEIFNELKVLAVENRSKISQEYFKDFILELYNYCKTKQQTGSMEFGDEAFKVLEFMDENSLLLENDGSMLEHNYTNSVATAVRIKKIEWAIDFIEQNRKKLPVGIRENAFFYNMAVVNFVNGIDCSESEKSEFLGRGLEFLGKVHTEDFYHTTRINNLKLLIFYEMGEYESSYNLIDTYRHFLHNNLLIPDNLRKRYLNFLNFMNRLFNIKSGSRKTPVDKLKIDVINNDTEYKKWILSKIDRLEKNISG